MKLSKTFKGLLSLLLYEENTPEEEGLIEYFLNNSTEYALTGSRFFSPKEVESTTDWDFFTQYSNAKLLYLKSLGFTTLYTPSSDYTDNNIVCVLRLQTPRIDIQLVKDFTARLTVRTIIEQFHLLHEMPKERRSEVWNALYMALLLPTPLKFDEVTLFNQMEGNIG